ncbi:aldehyde dehydrogenase [Haladaptatus sp. GCM10025893]|uniref:aldehyde dehydrogenase n=1 Tax=Haladaptatus sp. GCM10025893 TaxID=3252659 RepID=UPI00360B616E
MFVDGRFRASSGDDRIDVSFPYDGTVWATVPDGTAADVDTAVGVARAAFESDAWGDAKPSDRRVILNQIADTIDANTRELAELETLQNGKLLREMEQQMEALGEWYRYYGRICEEVESGRTIPVDKKDGQMFNYVRHEPYGVVGAITAWNSPLLLTAWKFAPALAAGNTVVQKPSEETPVSALRFAELVYEHTDLPPGVYNVVPGYGHTGAALTAHPDVDKLAFTGSTAVGREVAKTAGENLTKVSLELGGKSPNVIFPDADLNDAVNGVMKGIFAATGQTCMAGSRVLVHEDVHEEVVARLTEKASDIKLGDPRDPETEMGPVAFRGQWETVHEYVQSGLAEGATITVGGEMPADQPGECFIQPTVFVDVENDMTVAREEIFGPVASVISFEDEAAALDIANDTEFGLAAAIWTRDMDRANRFVETVQAGTVWVNEYRLIAPNSPFGGYKASGLGRENGREGLEEYYQTKSVWYNHAGEVGDPFVLDAE